MIMPFIIFQGCMKAITSEQIRVNLVEVSKNVESYSYEMEMYMETDIAGEDSEIAQTKAYGEIDVAGKRMMVAIDMDETISGEAQTKSTKTLMYVIDNMAYSYSQSVKGKGKWIKFEVPKDTLGNENRLKKLMDLLLRSKIKKLGDEKVENIDCYLVSVEPDPKNFWAVIMEQEEEHPLLELLDLDYADIIKDVDMKVWIAKKTFLSAKCHMEMKAVIERTIMKQPFRMTINVRTVCRYHDFNKLTAIELPEEAKGAELYEEEWD